jgi:hypothetical protein
MGQTSSCKASSGYIEQSRKQHVMGLAGKAKHQGAPRGIRPHHAIVQKSFHRGSSGSWGYTEQSRYITTLDFAA